MRRLYFLLPALLLPLGVDAWHPDDCLPSQANPRSYYAIGLESIVGTTYYVEERDVVYPVLEPNLDLPVPGTGTLFGQGTWIYEEQNGVGGLQRGGPGLTLCIASELPQCIVEFSDPVTDVSCGHGPDRLVF